MFDIIRHWFQRYFSDPEAVVLFFLLVLGVVLVMTTGSILAPVFASIVIAYLLEWIVERLQNLKIPRLAAVLVVYLGFLGLFFVSALVLLPAIWNQLASFFNEIPEFFTKAQATLSLLNEKFPQYFSESQLETIMANLIQDVRGWGKLALSVSLSSIPGLITGLVYFVLVPLLVFFFLKDRTLILTWVASFLPTERGLLTKVSTEVNMQIGNYIRGKVSEIIIVGFATFLVFWIMGLKYAILLAVLVGLSSLIPYVGGIVVTIPVAAVAYLQWGLGSEFAYLMGIYAVVQALDANILVPLLFSEAVNLHPVAIVVATLLFGGIWGFWGIFFAIPLATLVKAVIYAWPRQVQHGHRKTS